MVVRMLMSRAWGVAVTAVFVALAALACGGRGTPSGSSSAPTPLPQPSSPAPTGGGSVSTACALGPGQRGAACGKSQSRLHGAVLGAIDQLVQQSPQVFDKSSESGAGTGQFRVLDREGYLRGL